MGNVGTVLLVEDDQAVRKLISGVLEAHGHRVLAAVDGKSALAVAAAHTGEIHLVITDFGLGEMNGLQVAARIAGTRPGIGILLISGYTEIPLPEELRNAIRAEFLSKPFTMETLVNKVHAMIAVQDGGAERSR